jgi:hypothetical protein
MHFLYKLNKRKLLIYNNLFIYLLFIKYTYNVVIYDFSRDFKNKFYKYFYIK